MVPFEFWYTLIWVLVELGQGLLIEISITWDDIEDLEKTATKPGTVKIGNYIDEKKKYILKEIRVDEKKKKKITK